MTKMIHSMLRVLDETRSIEFYRSAFGLAIADRFEFDDFTLIYLRNSNASFELELTINHGREEPYAIGDGYGHLAVAVDALDAEHVRLTAIGCAPGAIRELVLAPDRVARFFFVQDPDGYKIEVLARGGRFS